jgi:cell division protein FtsX
MQHVLDQAGFLLWPFVVEGVLLGGVGAAAALVIVWAGFAALRTRLDAAAAAILPAAHVSFLSAGDVALVLLAGAIVGAASGAVASRAAA